MFTEVTFGYEGLILNELGERNKAIVWLENSPLFVQEKSVNRTEYYQAMQTGMKADKIVSVNKWEYLTVTNNAERKFARVRDSFTENLIDYTVVREFDNGTDNIELTLQRGVENASS